MIFDILPPGCGGRWAFGTIILIYLIVYNETSGPTAVFSTLLAAFYGLIAAICKSGTRNLQIPYIRATNKFDFICLFLAFWMDALTVLTACSTLARTLSICLDAMTGGLARILILGRNSIENEPWPDVLGVAVLFLVTGMFMLGLENTPVFGVLMTIGLLGISGMISIISWLKGNTSEWNHDHYITDNLNTFLTASALGTFAFPTEMSNKSAPGWKRLTGFIIIICVSISTILAAICLSTIVHFKSTQEFIAVPIFAIIDESNYHKLIPAGACFLMLASTGSLLELFPEMYSMIVSLATSEWKILSKQISYESVESGNPVLAIFIAGSLCSMLAFACPLKNLIYILAASHLCAGLLRAFYLLYSPYRPKFIHHHTSEASLKSYSRLATTAPPEVVSRPLPTITTTSSNAQNRSIWNFNSSNKQSLLRVKSNQQDIENEWLLLGEPSSCSSPSSVTPIYRNDQTETNLELNISTRIENSDSDISTDIDAIVDEYREQIKVTTAGPMERIIRMPTIHSWHLAISAMIIIFFGITSLVFGIFYNLHLPTYMIGFIVLGILLISIMMSFIPKYTTGTGLGNVSSIVTTISLTLGTILLISCIRYSWLAILFWFLGGLILLLRWDYLCNIFCCYCCGYNTTTQPQLPTTSPSSTFSIAHLLQQHATNNNVSESTEYRNSNNSHRILMPRPPKNILISDRIQGQSTKNNHNR